MSSTGLLTAVTAGGPVTITATSEGKSGTSAVTAIPVPVNSVAITPSGPHTLQAGHTLDLDVVARDATGKVLTGRAVAWSSSDAAVASVSGTGLVTAVAPGGPVTITAVSEGKSGVATVAVVPVPIASVGITPPGPHTLQAGSALDLNATAIDAAGNPLTGRAVTWSSSDAGVATVSGSGLVTAVAPGGPVTVSATSEGVSGTVGVTVIPAPVASVAITPPGPHTLQVGSTLDLSATAQDAAGNPLTGRAVAWSSSDAAVATVSGFGLVTAVAPGGPVTISATSEGVSGTVGVAVIPVPVASVAITPPGPHTLQVGSTLDLSATAQDAAGNPLTGRAVAWSSSDPSLVSVSGAGLVTALKTGGPVTITATSEGKSGTAAVSVTQPPFAERLPDGRVRIHPQVIEGSSNFVSSEPMWLGWAGNQFLQPFAPTQPYAGLSPSRLQRVSRVSSGAYAGWYETAVPVVGACFTVLQLSPSGRRWANLSPWTGRTGILQFEGHPVMRLPDDGSAAQRLRSWVRLEMIDNRRYVRFAPEVLPVDQESITDPWKLVGSANWNPADGRPAQVDGTGGVVADASGLRRFANVTARTSGREVWALYGHLGTGEIDLSGGGCIAPGTGFRHPDVRANADGAGLWLEPEMPDDPPYLNRNGSEGVVWWPDPDQPPDSVVRGSGFTAATPWFTIVDDPRAPEASLVEIDYVRLYARVNGRDSLIARNEYDDARVGGAYYQRRSGPEEWFGTRLGDIPSVSRRENGLLILPVGDHPEWIWHVWLHDPWQSAQGQHYRRTLPAGTDLVWVEARLRIRGAAVAQVGFDYYRNIIDDGCDRNNDGHYDPRTEDGYCEAGKSKYYFETFENGGWMTVRSNATTWTVNPNQ